MQRLEKQEAALAVWADFLVVWRRLAHGGEMVSYPACDFPLQDVRAITARIVDAVRRRRPFSFVRIGDGEGLLLSLSERSAAEDISYFSGHFGAAAATFQNLIRLREEMRRACQGADLIGVRDDILKVTVDSGWLSLPPPAMEQAVRRHFRLRPVEQGLPPFGCRRLALTNHALAQIEFPGMLFLVGAGLCGKVYCRWIREQGGIALDLGSVMDAWVGFSSRSAVMKDRFAPSPKQGGVPEELLLNRESVDRLLAGSDAETGEEINL